MKRQMTPEENWRYLDTLIDDNPDLDDGSLMALWGKAIRESREEAQQQKGPEAVVRVTLGESVLVDPERNAYAHQVKAVYLIKRTDVPAFVKAHNLNNKEFQALLDGKVQEYQGFRSLPFPGSMNRSYTPAQDHSGYEDLKLDNSKPGWTQKPRVYHAPKPMPIAQQWTPNEKEDQS